MDEAQEIKGKTFSGGLHWFHWLIVASSLLLTLGAWYVAKTQVEEKIENAFNREASQVVELITERMQKYEDALWSGVAALHSQSHGIDVKEWRRFSNTLQIETKYPGINGLGIIYYVPPEKLESFLEEQRKLRPGFRIHPQHDKNEYWPITYIEPVEMNDKAVGLDMAHETNRYTAAKKARDTGKAQITGPIVLVQDAQKTPGFLFYAPYYTGGIQADETVRRERFVGLVYAPFIMHKLMEGTLQKAKRHVGVKISDGNDILYDEHHPEEADYDSNPLFTRHVSLNFYGREWGFDIRSTLDFRNATISNQPIIILIGGIIIDSLLLALFILLSRSNKQAVVYANKVTKHLQDREARISAILNTTVDGVITMDGQGLIQDYNPACEHIFGYTQEEMKGENINKLMPEPDAGKHKTYLTNSHRTDEAGIIGIWREVEGKHKDGSVFPMELSVVQLEIENKTLYSAIVRDITERKKSEKEREDFIAKLTNSNEELERFAYVASHDLQEPLRMVCSFTQLLEKHYGEKLDDKAKEYIHISSRSATRMRELVEDLLEYARIGAEAEKYELVNCQEAMRYVTENLQESIEKSHAEIIYENLPTISANPVRLSRVLQNLVGNALKYQPASSQPRVMIGVEDKNDNWLFSVKDNGIGMKSEYCERIFFPFNRLHGKKEYSGTGMGLAICRKIIENMGGEIWAESEEGKGSIFYFKLPKPCMVQESQQGGKAA